MLREGAYLQDRYEIIDRIGSGGMSDVYKARDRKLNRLVGIKVLKEEFCNDHDFVSKFKMEAQSAAGLSHPNVVNVYDVVDEEDIHYIVMELVEGITLKSFIERKGRLGLMETVGIAIQIAQGIGAAHEQHIVHRDIKPQNVIISSDGKAKVADFGIARAASSDTLNSTAMGSVHYISPEQARGENSDERSDIYSLGISMYEMVTGKLPFTGDTTVAVALAQIENDMPLASFSNPEVTPAFDQILLKCCQKKPERRYQRIEDVIADLRRLLVVPEIKDPIGSGDDGHTRVLTEQEVGEINARAKARAAGSSAGKSVPKSKKPKVKYEIEDDEEQDGKFDKIITAAGIILALAVVAAVVFGILKFSGIIGESANEIGNAIDIVQGDAELISDKQTYVPNVLNLNYDLATSKLKDYSLDIEVASSEYSDTVEKDAIISQSPEADEIVDKYSKVSVVVSLGTNGEDLSGYLHSDAEKAREELLEKGYQVSIVEDFDDEYAEGMIIDINPVRAEKNSTITLLVSKGKEVELAVVPYLIGQSEEDAIGLLVDAELTPGEVTTASNDTVPEGCILSQSIAADTEISKGTAIGYTVSTGPEPINEKYVASIRTNYNLTDLIGPGSSGTKVDIMVQLYQEVPAEDGTYVPVITTLMEPRTVTGDTILPIRYDYIEGAYGVDQGQVQVVKADTGEILKSYDVEFFKQQ